MWGSSGSRRMISIRQYSTERGKAESRSRNCTVLAAEMTPPIWRRYICSPPSERSIAIQVRSVYGMGVSAPADMRMPACTSSTRLVMSARSTRRPTSRKA